MSNQQPDIKFDERSDKSDRKIKLITQEQLDIYTTELATQRKILNWTQGFIIAILIACFLTFIMLVIDAWKFHGGNQKRLIDKIEKIQQNYLEEKIQNLEGRIEELEKDSVINKPQKFSPSK